MSNITQLLKHAAGLEKRAYEQYATAFMGSTITALVKGGVGFDQASSMVKRACEVDPTLIGKLTNVAAFEKAAEYIEGLEVKLEKAASEAPLSSAKGREETPIHKLAGLGFTDAELEMMAQLPENLLTKVATTTSQPYSMGHGEGMSRAKTDPLLEFILG